MLREADGVAHVLLCMLFGYTLFTMPRGQRHLRSGDLVRLAGKRWWSGLALLILLLLVLKTFAERRLTTVGHENLQTFALLMPHAGGCMLAERDPYANTLREVAVLPSDCAGAQLAFGPGGREAVAWFTPADDTGETALFRVDTARGSFVRVRPPEHLAVETYVIDREGGLWALGLVQTETIEDGDEVFLLRGDERWPLPKLAGDAPYAWAIGMKQVAGTWQELEVQASRCCHDGAQGITALAAWNQGMKSRDHARLSAGLRAKLSPSTWPQVEAARSRKLKLPAWGDEFAASWVQISQPGWTFALLAPAAGWPAWRIKPPFLLLSGSTTQPLLENSERLEATGPWEVQVHGTVLLVSEVGTGNGGIYVDMRQGRRLGRETLAYAIMPWPR